MNKWSNYGKWRHPKQRSEYMNNIDKQYQALLQDILDNGVEKKDRTGTGTISVFGRQIRHKMSEGFPLLTTKKMPFKTIVTELLWFLRGDTNIKYLVDNGCNIWNGDAYKRYLVHTIEGVKNGSDRIKGYLDDCLVEFDGSYEHFTNPSFQYGYRPHTQEEFINKIKTDDEFANKWGELGPIYGKQWRNWEGYEHGMILGAGLIKEQPIDQIQNLINDLKTNPDSRRLMVNAWNVGELDQMVLPPCHYSFQVYTRELSLDERRNMFPELNEMFLEKKKNIASYDYDSAAFYREKEKQLLETLPTRAISLMWNQRSVDTFLGLPFNIASYGLLLEIIAKEVNMIPEELIGNLGDVHLYSNHIEQAKEQIGREFSLIERVNYGVDVLGYEGLLDYGHSQNEDELITELCDKYGVPTRTREPYPLPKLDIHPGILDYDLDKLEIGMFTIKNYQSHPTIKAPLSN